MLFSTWGEQSSDARRQRRQRATCRYCAGLRAVLCRDSAPLHERRKLLQHPEEASSIPRGREEFTGKGNTAEAEPIKTQELFQTQQNHGERWKRKAVIYNSLYTNIKKRKEENTSFFAASAFRCQSPITMSKHLSPPRKCQGTHTLYFKVASLFLGHVRGKRRYRR